MTMKLTKKEDAAFCAAGEPRTEPVHYMAYAQRLHRTLTPEQNLLLIELLDGFGDLVRYERRWYFHKGYLAAKRDARR